MMDDSEIPRSDFIVKPICNLEEIENKLDKIIDAIEKLTEAVKYGNWGR